MRVWHNQKWFSHEELCYAFEQQHCGALASLPYFSSVAVIVEESFTGISALLIGLSRKWKISIISRAILSAALKATLTKRGYSFFDTTSGDVSPGISSTFHNPDLLIVTSGTTGMPKCVGYSREHFSFESARNGAAETNWILTYLPGTYAWFNMLGHSLFETSDQLIVSTLHAPIEIFAEAQGAGPTAISATPSFFRSLLIESESEAKMYSGLRQITLGGEVADPRILQLLANKFPRARITHTYASSEAGLVLWCHDGLAGFPMASIEAAQRNGIEVFLRNGQLVINKLHDSQELITGDFGEFIEGRLHILGRNPIEQANVGGVKVDTRVVTAILEENRDVLRATVQAISAPIVGKVLMVEITLRGDSALMSDADLTHLFSREIGLRIESPAFIPRKWVFKRAIRLGNNFKELRQTDGQC